MKRPGSSRLRCGSTKGLPHLCRQGRPGERLLDEMDALVQDAVVGDDVGRVAGHVEAFHLRMDAAQFFPPGPCPFIPGMITSVMSRRMLSCFCASSMASPGVDAVSTVYPLPFEHCGGHLQDGLLVFHQQNRFVASRRCGRWGLPFRDGFRSVVAAQVDLEGRPPVPVRCRR